MALKSRLYIPYCLGGQRLSPQPNARQCSSASHKPAISSIAPLAGSRPSNFNIARKPLVGSRKPRAHHDRGTEHPCRPGTDASEAARPRKEICRDRRTATGKFWSRSPATHRARTPGPHFALAARQSSKRIRRRPPAHHRIRHHRGRYQGVAPLFHAASLLRRTRLLPMVHPRRRPLRAPLQSMRRHKGVRRLSPLAPRSCPAGSYNRKSGLADAQKGVAGWMM